MPLLKDAEREKEEGEREAESQRGRRSDGMTLADGVKQEEAARDQRGRGDSREGRAEPEPSERKVMFRKRL